MMGVFERNGIRIHELKIMFRQANISTCVYFGGSVTELIIIITMSDMHPVFTVYGTIMYSY